MNCDHNGEFNAVGVDAGLLTPFNWMTGREEPGLGQEAGRERRSYAVVHRLRQPDGGFKWKRSVGVCRFSMTEATSRSGLASASTSSEGPGQVGNQRATGAQIRAARGLVRWSVIDLAGATGISRATIRRLEEVDGPSSPNDEAILLLIEAAFSKAGVEFVFSETGKPGVRPR